MNATSTNFRTIIEGEKQFVVPLFQRTYSWKAENVDTLWKDIADLYTAKTDATAETVASPAQEHFIGSFVTIPATATPVGINKYILIDGQQRMTTLLLFLAAIRQIAIERGQHKLAHEIRDLYLTNQYKEGEAKHKLLPTPADQPSFFAVASWEEGSDVSELPTGNLQAAVIKTQTLVGGLDSCGVPYDLHRLKNIVTGSLSLVSITLSATDNPYVIFQSLNGTGAGLTQGDLIRNYFFMRLPPGRQDDVYMQVWLPMQEALTGTGGKIDWFFRHYLAKDGVIVKLDKLFEEVKARADKHCHSGQEVENYLREIARFAGHYRKLSLSEGEPLIAKRGHRINRWNLSTAYPLMLALYDDFALGKLTTAQFAELLGYIESFAVRRFFANIPTNRLAGIFATAYRSTAPKDGGTAADRMTTLPSYFRSQTWPDDAAFKQGFVRYPLYGETGRCKFILELLNEAMQHKEKIVYDTLTIEHIMPQTLTDNWKQMLGDDYERIYSSYVNSIGNLTLTGYNGTMGNKPYAEKRAVYTSSNVTLNAYFEGTGVWDESEITSRADILAQLATKIWSRPQ